MNKDSKIYVTGAEGLVGSAVVRQLQSQGYTNIICTSRTKLYHNGYSFDGNFDLRDEQNVKEIFKRYGPEYVINAAGVVGGINANNTRGAEFIHDNILMQTNIIHMSYLYNVKKLLFLGSSCIYPKICPQPIKEEYLLTSNLEETNIGYAIAKISGLIMCRMYNKQYGSNFISAMPTNLYGPCFSEDTDILTKNGIKNIKEIQVGEEIYTLNPNTLKMEECKVSHIQQEYDTIEYAHFSSRGCNFLVTPDHNMFFKTSTGFVKRKAEYFRTHAGRDFGQIVLAHHNIETKNYNENEEIDLTTYTDSDHIITGDYVRDFKHSGSKKYPLQYRKDDFYEFLGWYITKGSLIRNISQGGRFSVAEKLVGRISIAQSKIVNFDNWNRIYSLLMRMKIPFYYNDAGFYFSSRLFSNFILKHIKIGSMNKRIPDFILKENKPYYLKRLFESMMLGDGHKNGYMYSTSSLKLKEDFIHLSFLLGLKANSSKNGNRVFIKYTNKYTSVKYKNIQFIKVPKQRVYCLTTEKNHIIYAGRDYKFNWIGQCDNFNLTSSHVLPALIRKFHDAKINGDESVVFWGTGSAKREFLYVDDLAEALVFLMNNYDDCKEHINVGTGQDLTIKELVMMIKEIVDYDGKIFWNADYPDGTPQKLLDVSKINNLGWAPATGLHRGIRQTYKWFVDNYENIRK